MNGGVKVRVERSKMALQGVQMAVNKKQNKAKPGEYSGIHG